MTSRSTKALLIAGAVIGGIAVGIYTDPDLSRKVEHEARELLPPSGKTTKLYRWQDAKGVVQVSDQPPPPGIEYQIVEYDPNANLMPKEHFTGQE
jgi:hypothetical protein